MTGPRRQGSSLLSLGGRGYDLIKKSLGVYGTAVALIQLLPALFALLVVAFSPTALLSPTLRRWLLLGTLCGSVAGMLLFAVRAGLGTIRKVLRGERVARSSALVGLARTGLVLAILTGAALRLHLAVVDVAFVDRFRWLTPLFDYYLGGGPFAALLFNVLAALLAGALLTAVVAGAPAALLARRERRRSLARLAAPGGPLGAMDEAVKALEQAKKALLSARAGLIDSAIAAEQAGPTDADATKSGA